jgi:hypothetical protein
VPGGNRWTLDPVLEEVPAEMVQVDVFWSYGLGATLAVASSRQLLARRRAAALESRDAASGSDAPVGPPVHSRWRDPYLLRTLLFLALVFAPSGVYLVWEFPSWETMHVGDRDMPAWLIATFAITNVTLGLLGFWVVERLLAAGRSYLAYLQILVGYVGMFFILVHGWDGKGYQRFFSPTHADFVGWDGDWAAWLTSDVALTLLGMGAVLVPILIWAAVSWQREGYRLAPATARRPGVGAIAALLVATVFAAGLGLSIAASLVIHALGAPAGVPAALALCALALVPGGPVHALYRAYGLPGAEEARAARAVRPAGRAARAAA